MVGDFPRIDGAKLRHRRICAGLSQRELEERCSITSGQLSRIEKGVQQPRPHRLVALAAALGVEPAELLAAVDAEPAGAEA